MTDVVFSMEAGQDYELFDPFHRRQIGYFRDNQYAEPGQESVYGCIMDGKFYHGGRFVGTLTGNTISVGGSAAYHLILRKAD